MKSAYELAMERFAKAEPGEPRTLTEAQKARVGEINSLYQSKLAERETFLKSLLVRAEGTGDGTEAEQLRQQLSRDVQSIREEWESKKEQVWREAPR